MDQWEEQAEIERLKKFDKEARIKKIKIGVALGLCLCAIVGLLFGVYACKYKPDKGIQYLLNEGGKSYCVYGVLTAEKEHIEIPSKHKKLPVTKIEENAFKDCKTIKSITIPDTVKEIGDCAFLNCSGLTSIEIPNSVTKMGEYAFKGCTGLATIKMPTNLVEEENTWWKESLTGMFTNCASLTNVTIPMGVTTIGKSAFEGCISLTEVSIPKSVTRIEESAFRGCASLTNIEIPNHVTMIGTSAFRGCSSLESVEMPEKMDFIETYIFSECTALKSVVLSKKGEGFFYYNAFNKCVALENVYLRNDEVDVESFEKYLGHDVNFYYYSEEEIGAWWHYDVDDNIVDYTMS